MTIPETPISERIKHLPNSTYVVNTRAGAVLVNSPPETLKSILAAGLRPPSIILLPPDLPLGQEVGSSGFVRRGISYACVEFPLYSNFFVEGKRTILIAPTTAQAERVNTILVETILGPRDPADYGDDLWLQQECAAVSFSPKLGHAPTPEDLADVRCLETGGGDLGHGVTIALEDEHFVFREDGVEVARVSTIIHSTPRPLTMAPPRPLLRHELTLQFIGGSDGFDPAGITTCFLAYLGEKSQPTLFDAAAYLRMRLGNLGISPRQVSEVVLSHLHEDHLAGLPELLLMGDQRVRLLTADVVYKSLLRLLSAMLNLHQDDVAALFDYYPLNPGQPLDLDGRRFESIYAVHSIPTIAVRLDALYYSGDMRYNEAWFDELVDEGVLSPERRDNLIGFAEGARVLVQDAGGGAVHTTVTRDVLRALASKSQRVILAHTSRHQLPAESDDLADQVEFASSGHVSSMGEVVARGSDVARLETITACPLFARLPRDERVALASQTTLHEWNDGEVIMRAGENAGGQTYVIHMGLVGIWDHQELLMVVGRGMSVGERGALRGRVRMGTLIARGPVQLLGLSPELFGPVAERLGLMASFDRADWLWHLPLLSTLPWSTLLDLALDFQPRQLESGAVLFAAGEPAYECYLLVKGGLAMTGEHDQPMGHHATPGSFVGGRDALLNKVRTFSVVATEPTEVWALPAPALQRLHMVYPHIMLHLRVAESGLAGEEGRSSDVNP